MYGGLIVIVCEIVIIITVYKSNSQVIENDVRQCYQDNKWWGAVTLAVCRTPVQLSKAKFLRRPWFGSNLKGRSVVIFFKITVIGAGVQKVYKLVHIIIVTHPFNGHLSGTTQVSRYQKGKTNLDFTEAWDSEWQWHQLGHMQVCTLSRQITTPLTPALHPPLTFYRLDALLAAQPTASKHWRPYIIIINNILLITDCLYSWLLTLLS